MKSPWPLPSPTQGWLSPPRRPADFVGVTATPQGFLLPVLGILVVTSEWSQRTGLVSFTLEPSRGRILMAKVAAVLVLGVVAIVLLVGLAALGNVLGANLQGGDGSWTFGVEGSECCTAR